MARRTALLRKSGPYEVIALDDGRLVVVPSYSGLALQDLLQGPGQPDNPVIPQDPARLQLAKDMEDWLNS